MGRRVSRGDVCWYDFQPPDKRRPVLVLTRDSAIDHLTGITIAPLTTTIRGIPTEVVLTPDLDGVPETCAVNLDNLQTVRKAQLGTTVTHLTPARVRAVEYALLFALGIAWRRANDS